MTMFDIINPSNEDVIRSIELAEAADVDRAVAKAQKAQETWSRLKPTQRSRILRVLAQLVDKHADELASLESLNVGKPLADAKHEALQTRDVLDYYSSTPERLVGTQYPVDGGVTVTFEEPVGVVGLIVPWNFPMISSIWGMVPALAAGNAVVLKPSELTPLTAWRLAELALEAGFPEGLLEVVVGTGEEVGERIVAHPGVAKIVFTGSTAVGQRIASVAAPFLKPLTLELGGKSASLIFADADLKQAAFGSTFVFHNAGQDCCARGRVLVQREVFDEFMGEYETVVKALRVGPPDDTANEIGPVISRTQLDRVEGFIDGSDEVAFRGSAPTGRGFWFPPTVVTPYNSKARVMQEEVFGPVAAVVPFDTEEEAVAIANETQFGLSGSVWTSDGKRGLRVARQVKSGVVSVNSSISVRYSTPFGGMKMSGIGRELGPDAPFAFTETKAVFLAD